MGEKSVRNRISSSVKRKSLTVSFTKLNGVQAQVLDHPLART